jgi:hypothetical protein
MGILVGFTAPQLEVDMIAFDVEPQAVQDMKQDHAIRSAADGNANAVRLVDAEGRKRTTHGLDERMKGQHDVKRPGRRAPIAGVDLISPKISRMRILVVLFLGLALVASACKPESAPADEAAEASSTTVPAPDSLPRLPMAGDDGHDFTFLTHQLWHYSGAVGPQELGPEPYKNEWIDFDPNGTFVAGKGKDETHRGTWAYNEEEHLLGIRPLDAAFKASEWKVMLNNQMMVWIGTRAFGNQSTQIRLVRHENRPE